MTNEKATEGADEVRALEFSLESAVVLADLETLERLHAEDFTFIHSTGRIDTKESWLGRIRSGESSFRRRTLSDLDVEMHDDVAVTSGRIEVETGSGRSYEIRYVRVYAMRVPGWQLVSHRSIDGPPAIGASAT